MQVRDAIHDVSCQVTWVRAAQRHLTLRFFADAAEVDVAGLREGMDAACHALPLFTTQLEGLGVFPESGPPRVLWMGVSAGRESVEALARALTSALAPCGWPAEERAFHPHITLGRIKQTGDRQGLVAALQRCRNATSAPFEVEGLALIRSALSSRGPQHTTIYHATLRSHT